MTVEKPIPCALCEKWDKRRANEPSTNLCETCYRVHPANTFLWRSKNPGFNDLFKEIDAKNEDPYTCVTRRERYARTKMAALVVESWKRCKVVPFLEKPGLFFCPRTAKEDTFCHDCWRFMEECGFGDYINGDHTVNEDKLLKDVAV